MCGKLDSVSNLKVNNVQLIKFVSFRKQKYSYDMVSSLFIFGLDNNEKILMEENRNMKNIIKFFTEIKMMNTEINLNHSNLDLFQ